MTLDRNTILHMNASSTLLFHDGFPMAYTPDDLALLRTWIRGVPLAALPCWPCWPGSRTCACSNPTRASG